LARRGKRCVARICLVEPGLSGGAIGQGQRLQLAPGFGEISTLANNAIAGQNLPTIFPQPNSISITCNGKLKMHAAQGIEMTSDADIKITANTTIDAEATAPMTLKGATVNIN